MRKIILLFTAILLFLGCTQHQGEIIEPNSGTEYTMVTTMHAWDVVVSRVSDECYDVLSNYALVIKDRPIECGGRKVHSTIGCCTPSNNEIALASDLDDTQYGYTLSHEFIHALADCEQGLSAEPFHYDPILWRKVSTENDPYEKVDNENDNNVEDVARRMIDRDKKHPVIIQKE